MIKRYDIDDHYHGPEEDPKGDWVKWEDVKGLENALEDHQWALDNYDFFQSAITAIKKYSNERSQNGQTQKRRKENQGEDNQDHKEEVGQEDDGS